MNKEVKDMMDSFDMVADAWVALFVEIRAIVMFAGCILVWLLIILLSPVWVGPYLLYRKFRKERECSE